VQQPHLCLLCFLQGAHSRCWFCACGCGSWI
jgi:hypothetical protein